MKNKFNDDDYFPYMKKFMLENPIILKKYNNYFKKTYIVETEEMFREISIECQ